MKSHIIKFIIMLFLAYIALMPIYLYFYGSYPIPSKDTVVLQFGANHYYLVGEDNREVFNIVENISNNLNAEQISFVMNNVPQDANIQVYMETNFHYDNNRSKDEKALKRTYSPEEFFSKRSGVCGDYAFFYAAYFLGKESSATFIAMFPDSSSIGHIFEVQNDTAYDISISQPLSKHLRALLMEHSYVKLYYFYVTFTHNAVDVYSIENYAITNTTSIILPIQIDGKAYVLSSGKTIASIKSFPKVFPETVVNNKTIILPGITIIPVSNGYILIGKSNTITVIFRNYSYTTYYLGPVVHTKKILFYTLWRR